MHIQRETFLSQSKHLMIGLTLNWGDFVFFLFGKMGEIVKFQGNKKGQI